jgi:hypothetical protein
MNKHIILKDSSAGLAWYKHQFAVVTGTHGLAIRALTLSQQAFSSSLGAQLESEEAEENHMWEATTSAHLQKWDKLIAQTADELKNGDTLSLEAVIEEQITDLEI